MRRDGIFRDMCPRPARSWCEGSSITDIAAKNLTLNNTTPLKVELHSTKYGNEVTGEGRRCLDQSRTRRERARPRGRRLARPIRQAPSPPNRSPVRKDFGTRLQKPRVCAPPGQQKAKQWLWSGVACGWKRSDTSPKASRHVASSSEKRKAAGGGGGGGGEAVPGQLYVSVHEQSHA